MAFPWRSLLDGRAHHRGGGVLILLAIGALGAVTSGSFDCGRLPTAVQRSTCERVVREAEKSCAPLGIDPAFVAAIAGVESSFRPSAVSWAGAIGAMQVLPVIGRRLGFSRDRLLEVEGGVQAACLLLREMRSRSGGDIVRALSLYVGASAPRYVGRVMSSFLGRKMTR